MLNQELSQLLKEKYPQWSDPRQCYRNIYGLCMLPEFELDKLKIVYCYLPVDTDHLFFRHAVLKYADQYVDTILNYPEKYERIYVIKEFNFQEYMEAVVADGSFELHMALRPLEQMLIEQHHLEIV